MSVFKSNFDLLKCLIECLRQICSEWDLEFEENVPGDQSLKVCTFSVRTPDLKACARLSAVLVFDDQIVMYAKLGGECRTVKFNVNDFMEASLDRFPSYVTGKLSSKLVATVFAPFFRPNKEYNNLCQLSTVATIHICSYLSVRFLHCRLHLSVLYTRLMIVLSYHRQQSCANLPKRTGPLEAPHWLMLFGASLSSKVHPHNMTCV